MWLGSGEMDLVPTAILGLPSTHAYRIVPQRPRPSSSYVVVTTGEPRLKPPPEQESRLQNITSLRVVLVSVGASARSPSRELAASPEDLRAAAATLEASTSQAALPARASALDAISSARDSAAGGFRTAEALEVGTLVWFFLSAFPLMQHGRLQPTTPE